MIQWRSICFAVVALCAGAHGVSAASLEVFGRLPSLGSLAISPNGKFLAYDTDLDGKRIVVILALDTSKPVGAFDEGGQKLRDLQWADDDHLLITSSTTSLVQGTIGSKSEYYVTQVFNLQSHLATRLIHGIANSMNVDASLPEVRTVDGRTIVYVECVHFVDGRGVDSLFSDDLSTEHGRLVEIGTKDTTGWWVDSSGSVAASTEYDDDTKRWNLKLFIKGVWTEVDNQLAPIDTPEIVGFAADGNSLFVRSFRDDRIIARQVKMTDGNWTTLTDEKGELNSAVIDPRSRRVIGYVLLHGRSEYSFVDPADQRAWNSVVKAYEGENVELVSWSDDRARIVVRVDGTRHGSEYELVDLKTNVARVLGEAYDGVGPADVSEVKYISFRAADGTEIPAFLTLPSNKTGKKLALVVLPHGGPESQDTPGFDWWSQALASRGYAVLQPEFRGSTGFGWQHLSAGFGQWGRKMQTDLSDGVRFLAAQGLIDPKKVCIVGGSYGGYAALAGPTLDRGVYRCAVAVAGISDPHNMLEWERGRAHSSDNVAIRYWKRFMGVDSIDDPKLADISPLAHVAQADAPILLIHGSDDTVVPIAQSTDMESALRAAGKPVSLVTLKSEDHWLSRSETRENMLEATVKFLEASNPPN